MPSMDKPNEWKTEYYVNAVGAILLALGMRYGASSYIPAAGAAMGDCSPSTGEAVVAVAPPTSIKLSYFDSRGRAEAIRVALKDHLVPFEDHTFTVEEWGKTSPTGLKAQYTADDKLAFGQVPLLDVNEGELFIVQSHAILKYLGRHYGFYQGTPEQLALVDLLSAGTEDARSKLMKIKYSPADEAVKAAMYEVYFAADTEAPRWLGYFETVLANRPKHYTLPFIAGTPEISVADYLLFDLLDTHMTLKPEETEELMAGMPKLIEYYQKIAARVNIKAYFASSARRD